MLESVIRNSFAVHQIHPFVAGARSPSLVEVDASWQHPGRFVQVWEENRPTLANAGHHQRWYLFSVGGFGPHAYYIFNVGYRKFLTNVQDVSRGLQVTVGEGFPAINFAWQLVPGANGSANIVNVGSVQGLVYAGTQNGSPIKLEHHPSGSIEFFDLTTVIGFQEPNSGSMVGRDVMLIPMHDQGRCVDLPAGNTANEVAYQTWVRMLNNGNQVFHLERAGTDIPGSFYIRNVHSGKVLMPQARSLDNGVPIVQEPISGNGAGQQWNLYAAPDGDDFVYIINTWTGLALDVRDWGRANGSGLQQWMLHGGENQRFKITMPSV